jgi:valyl-tRNA synthetase
VSWVGVWRGRAQFKLTFPPSIPFWVCRMIMLGLKMTGKIPFNEVFCHGLVRDSDGRKMSKSLGNVVDPLDFVEGISLEKLHEKLKVGNLNPNEYTRAAAWQRSAFPGGIPQCGTDALRFWATSNTSASAASDINLDVAQLHAYRKFSNKIFQATKYVMGKLPDGFVPGEAAAPGKTLAERWILHKMNAAAHEINDNLERREFAKASLAAYRYWYSYLCDIYIENSKSIIQDGSEEERNSAIQTLYTALDAALRLIHPFMPFLSEELWQRLPRRPAEKARSIMVAAFPEFDETLSDAAAAAAYERVIGCSFGARSLMAEYGLKDKVKVILQAHDDEALATLVAEEASIKTLCGKGVEQIEIVRPGEARPAGCVAYPVSSALAVFLYVRGRVDMDAEIGKAAKKLDKVRAALDKQRRAVADDTYLEKATANVQQADRLRITSLEAEARTFEGTIEQFERLKLE